MNGNFKVVSRYGIEISINYLSFLLCASLNACLHPVAVSPKHPPVCLFIICLFVCVGITLQVVSVSLLVLHCAESPPRLSLIVQELFLPYISRNAFRLRSQYARCYDSITKLILD